MKEHVWQIINSAKEYCILSCVDCGIQFMHHREDDLIERTKNHKNCDVLMARAASRRILDE